MKCTLYHVRREMYVAQLSSFLRCIFRLVFDIVIDFAFYFAS